MKTYWEYDEQERAALTSEQVEALMDAELMTKGVLKPVAPKLHAIPASPLGEKLTVYGIRGKSKYGSDEHVGICFETAELAARFLELNPMVRDNDYEVGSEFHYAKTLADCAIVSETLFSMEQINLHRSALKNRKAKSEENEKLSSAFTKACNESDKVTRQVWSDWHALQSTKAEMQKVVNTFAEYKRMTSDDEPMAMNFLAKVFNERKVAQAREWFPGAIPGFETVVAAPAEKAVVMAVPDSSTEEPSF